MVYIRRNPGLFLSGIFHILILAIPVSLAVVQKFDEMELFLMTEDSPVVQRAKVMKKQKTSETTEVREETKETEKPQIIEEKPKMKVEKTIEPAVISNKAEAIPLSVPENPNPPKAEVHEAASAPQLPFSKDTSSPHDVEFGMATGPKFLHREMPVYPMMARKFGKEGSVVLRLTIDAKGDLLNVEVIERASFGFTEAAIEAVKRSAFLPAKKDGSPITSRAILPIRFMLRRN